MKNLRLFAVLLFCVLSLPVFAGSPPALLPIIDQIYSGNNAQAKATISGYVSANPSDPYGYILRGIANEWDQLTHNKGNSLDGQIMSDYQKARTLAEEALATAPDDINKKIALGNALIYVAKKQIDAGRKVQAGNIMKEANNLMKEVLAANPNSDDAYFAMGLFNYFSANVPAGFKWLAALLGFKGDKNLGISYLNKAAAAKSITQGDAKFMLVYVYGNKEKQYSTALGFANDLYARFPGNAVFLYNVAEIQYYAKQLDESRVNFEKLVSQCESNPDNCNDRYHFSGSYFLTRIFIDQKNDAQAKKYVEKTMALDKNKFKDRSTDLKKWATQLGVTTATASK